MVSTERSSSQDPSQNDRVVTFEKDVVNNLNRLGNPLVGCIRRNLKTQELDPTPYDLQRNALLGAFADHHIISTPVGPIGIWLYDNTVVRVNGGDVRWWWTRELEDEWCLVNTYSGYTLRPYAYFIQLVGPRMLYHCVNMDDFDEEGWKEFAGDCVQAANADPTERIAKNMDRAYIACKRCPVKIECDTIDAVTPQGKADWGRSYPFP